MKMRSPHVFGQNWLRVALGLTLVALLFVAACDLLDLIDEFEPTGIPFNLDPDIEVISITGSKRNFSDSGQVTIDFKARSRNSGTEDDILPGGLFLTSGLERVQHVILLKSHRLEVGPEATLRVVGTFCCNERDRTPDDGDTLQLGPITDNSDLQDLVDLVRDRDISRNLGLVERAVYMVTDSTGLTQAYRDSISRLPPEG
ncbi:MAG: hypothetical protein JSU73_08965 [candidate division WOR-3 bacterium]|nr:MAG: hypothetical protein JSU73_08965 [candidate division WOR-3 bacterium]